MTREAAAWSNSRMRPLRIRIELAAAAIALPLFACAVSQPTAPPMTGGAHRDPVRKILVCAPNTVLSLVSELHGGSAPVRAEIEGYLRDHDREVEWVNLVEAKSAWKRALEKAKEESAIESTPAIFADELASERSFDALLMPSILLHETSALHGFVEWDGVKRRIRYSRAPSQRMGQRFARSFWLGVPVTSVHFLVFSRGGERVFEGRGGLEIAVEVGRAREGSRSRLDFHPRGDLFDDRGTLREGVAVALGPYLASLAED